MWTRRGFSATALGFVGAALAAAKSKFDGVEIGVQTYSFREMSLDQALAAMANIGFDQCELFWGNTAPSGLSREGLRQWRLTVPLSHFQDIRDKFKKAGVGIFAYDPNIRDDYTEAEMAREFEFTKALGTDKITTSTTLTCAKRIAPLADKYGVKVALHGHDETNKANEFSSPQTFAEGLAMSPNFYINLDIGHFSSAGFDPVSYIREHHAKIMCLHVKDRRKNHGHATPFGEGDTPIKEVLLLLKRERYPIPADIEYEYNDDMPGVALDTITEVRKCFEYCKRTLQSA
jgi:sugar phosphate isomerase/epimerase